MTRLDSVDLSLLSLLSLVCAVIWHCGILDGVGGNDSRTLGLVDAGMARSSISKLFNLPVATRSKARRRRPCRSPSYSTLIFYHLSSIPFVYHCIDCYCEVTSVERLPCRCGFHTRFLMTFSLSTPVLSLIPGKECPMGPRFWGRVRLGGHTGVSNVP